MPFIAAMFLVFLLSVPALAFDVDRVADFVVDRNQEVETVRSFDRNIFKNVKLDARASIGRQIIDRDTMQVAATSTGYFLETSSTTKRFELLLTIPLIDPRENMERKLKTTNFVVTKRADVVKIAAKLKSLIDLSDYLGATNKTEKTELDWMKKRVEAGVDSQKDYNAATHKYNQDLFRYYETVAQATELVELLASYVPEGDRAELKTLIGWRNGQALSKN